MAVQRNRPIDALQRIMTSMKNFERKLDKLQEDVSVHGQALTDLRGMVANLSGGTILSAGGRSDENRRRTKTKTNAAAVQYEEKIHFNELLKLKSRDTALPLPPAKSKSTHSPHPRLTPLSSPYHVPAKHKEPAPRPISPKHSQKHKKAELHRKANEKRGKKNLEKRSKLTK